MKKILLLPFLLFSICTMVNAQLSVFSDSYGAGATFSDFGGSINAVSIDNTVAYSGTSSIKAIVPSSSYTGGAFKAATPQNLSSYNAISFWVKADAAKTLNVTGISNNGTAAVFQAEYINLPVSTTWTKYIIPIPASGKLTAEDGLFHFAEGSDEGPYTLWFDDIQYENSAAVGAFSPAIASQTLSPLVGGTFTPNGQTLSVLVNGAAQTIKVSLASFNFTSSDTNVATIVNGVGTAVGAGTATITGTLNGVAATGTITVNVAATNGPATAAPTPTRLAANVISLFSNAYTDVSGTNWNPNWGQSTQVSDIMLYTNSTKKYDNLNYQGIELSPAVSATGMEFLHFDIWTPNCTAFDLFLVNPGPIEQAVTVNPTASGWNSFDIPLSSYNTIALNNIFQMKLVGTPFGTSTVYLDNLYFYKNPPSSVPLIAAPTPTRLAANVVSLFSNAYTNVAGTDWNPNWGQSTVVTDVTIAGNDAKKYTTLNYQGVTFTPALSATGMQFLHFDLWTPNCTAFDLFLVNPGPIEQAVTVNPTASGWNSFDIPLTSYNNINLANIIQFKLVGTPFGTSTVWLDNIYLYKNPPTVPLVAAPTPTRLAANVISVFSNAYTNVAGTDFNPNWGQATVASDVTIAGNDTKKYATLSYQGIVLGSAIDASAMEFVHFDVWTPTALTFDFFLISPGPQEKPFPTNPAAGTWVGYDVPLSAFAPPVALNNIFQIKLVGTPSGGTVYLDNIYFYKNPITAPITAAPTPTRLAANVVSLFSNAYTDVAGTDWNPNWGQSTVVSDVTIAGNDTKKYATLNYQGVALTPALSATGMQFLHFDLWTPNCTAFDFFLINPGPIEQAVTVNPTTYGWNSFDIPLSSYNTIALNNIIQFKLVGTPFGTSTVWLDNIYFYKDPITAPITAAPTPTRLPANVVSLFSNAYTDVAGTDWNPNWGQSTVVTDVTIAGNDTKKYATLNYQGVAFTPAANATGMQFLHFDLWTPNCTAFDFFLINPGPIEQAVTVNPTASGWNSFDIPLTSYNNIALNNIIQFKLVGTPFGTSTVWLDNIYFYKDPLTAPITAAPTPTRLAANVVSLFSNAYTNVAGTDWNPNWGQSTVVTDVTIAGNDTKKYATLNYQGVALTPALSATGMQFLHFDLWTPNCTAFDFFLINPGPIEQAVTVNPTASGWNSFDIPLTSYNTIALNNIIQFKLVGTPFGTSTVWLDNIYFYKEPAVSLTAKVYLEHVSISSGLMSESLPDLLSFPASDPYSATPLSTKFAHVMNGAVQTTTAAVLTTNDNTPDDIVDWIFIELRSGTSGSSTVAYTQAALLQRDGDIVNSANGLTAVEFPNAPIGNYFVTIRHKNHLGFRTNNKIAMTSSTAALNFTNGSITLFGTAPTKTIGSVETMNAGDADSDGSLDSIDSGIWETENGSFNEYSDNSDYNLDASVDALDSALWEVNNGKYQEID